MKPSIVKSSLTTGLLLAASLSSASASPHSFLMQHNSTNRTASTGTFRLGMNLRNETDLARADLKSKLQPNTERPAINSFPMRNPMVNTQNANYDFLAK